MEHSTLQVPRPLGFTPTPAWKLFPPGGFLLQAGLLVVSMISHMLQVITLVSEGDFAFSAVSLLFIAMGCFAMMLLMEQEESISSSMNVSIKRGLPTYAWYNCVVYKGLLIDVGFLYVTCYAMLRERQLTAYQAVNAFSGLLLGVKDAGLVGSKVFSVPGGNMNKTCAGRDAATSILVPYERCAESIWHCLQILCEIVFFAVASYVLHPIVTVSCLMLQACPVGWMLKQNREKEGIPTPFWFAWLQILMAPSLMIHGGPVSLLMTCRAPHPGWLGLLCNLTRLSLWSYLIVCVDLPHGIAPFSTLSRPMGSAVLWQKIIDTPLKMLVGSGCPEILSSGSCGYTAAIVSSCALVPVYMLGMLPLLCFHTQYRNGAPSNNLIGEICSLGEEIEVHAEMQRSCDRSIE